jgi:hypothetical protein
MGCDIHSVAQIKKQGEWITVMKRVGGDHRNYNTFQVLANVRSSVYNPTFYEDVFLTPRGFPIDFIITENNRHSIQKNLKNGEDLSLAGPPQAINIEQEASDDESIWMGEHSFHFYTAQEFNIYTKAIQNIKLFSVNRFFLSLILRIIS